MVVMVIFAKEFHFQRTNADDDVTFTGACFLTSGETRFVGQGVSAALQCFIIMTLFVTFFIKKLQLMRFGNCTWPHCDLD